MKKQALYSSSRPASAGRQTSSDQSVRQARAAGAGSARPVVDDSTLRAARRATASESARPAAATAAESAAVASAPTVRARLRSRAQKWRTPLAALLGAALAFAGMQLAIHRPDARPPLTQEDIDNAVVRSLQTVPMPSPAAKAYEIIAPSVVKVRGFGDEKDGDAERGTGSGVVVLEDGTIMTNLHVVSSAKRIKVTFFDGTESAATVVGAQPENDLAILKATTLPDDLEPAMLRGTGDLREGEQVVAVGFPFGIGPSVTAGVVSGLRREYRNPEGEKLLTNLIQFDAAANPGSSGGPLITNEGEVVGIVTAILNPNGQRSFVGIGFAVPIENAARSLGTSPF